MKTFLFLFVALILMFKPSLIGKLFKNTFLLIVLALMVIGCCLTSCVTSFSSSVIPRTNVSISGNRASVNTPYGTISSKLPSYPINSQHKTINGAYCKRSSMDVVKCLQIVPQGKTDGYDVFLIVKTNTIDTLSKEYHLSLQKIDGAYYLIRDKVILVSIKEGKAVFKNETFKYTNK